MSAVILRESKFRKARRINCSEMNNPKSTQLHRHDDGSSHKTDGSC